MNKPVVALFTALWLASPAALPADETPTSKPHVLYLFTDRQHAGMLTGATPSRFGMQSNGEMKNVAAEPAYATELARHRQFMREWVAANQDKIAATYIMP